MRTASRLLIASLFLLAGTQLFAQKDATGKPDRTLSPYFFVQSDDPTLDQLPLKSTTAEVQIAGVMADVKVTQTYENKGKRPIEAIYVFPGSTNAAVHGMRMTIGERVLEAKIEEKQQARAQYQAAKQQGKSASLLEQHRPNVFQMNVANIMPGDVIKVELSYTELLVPTEGVYEFAYPTVVGPRYSEQEAATASAEEAWVENPYTKSGVKPTYKLDITTVLNAGMPLQNVRCTSHEVDVEFTGQSSAAVYLRENEVSGGNRDYILQYKLRGDEIQSGLMLYRGKKENYFMMMVEPPDRIETSLIPTREYMFIVDVSGSMGGFPLNTSKELLRDLIGGLTSMDKFNVLLFASGNSVLSPTSMPATKENIDKAINLIDRQGGGGGTQLIPALKEALAMKQEDGVSRSIVIATDGYVSVEKEAFDLIRNNMDNSNFFAFGIGSSVNRFLIEGMAHAGQGEPFVITNAQEAHEKAEKFREYIKSPMLADISIQYNGFDAYDIEPATIPDVLSDRPIIVYGKYRGAANGSITVKGMNGEGDWNKTYNASTTREKRSNRALKFLWARKRIQMLDDYNNLRKDDSRIKEITQLGLDYNLLTNYTSFIAVDSKVRNQGGYQETVDQPLPLPEGVSNQAIGNTVSKPTSKLKSTSSNSNTTGLTNGTYTVKVTDSNGVTTSGTSDGSITVTGTGGTAGNTYNWSQPTSAPVAKQSVVMMNAMSVQTISAESVRKVDRADLTMPSAGAYRVTMDNEADEATETISEILAEKEESKKRSEETRVFSMVEKMPEYPGGQKAMMEFLEKNIKYPESAKNAKEEGTVYVTFIVDEYGNISDVKVRKGVNDALDAEALRVVKLMKTWLPGEQKGKKVKVRMNLPIRFTLDENE